MAGKSPSSTPRGSAALLRLTLAGLPELELFPTREQRDAALASVVADVTPARRSWWSGVAVLLAAVAAVGIPARRFVPRLGLPGWCNDLILMVLVGGCAVLVIRWLHRSGAQPVLRDKLLDAGVAVCIACGYDLRGQPRESRRCPECGREMDPRAARLIAGAGGPPAA